MDDEFQEYAKQWEDECNRLTSLSFEVAIYSTAEICFLWRNVVEIARSFGYNLTDYYTEFSEPTAMLLTHGKEDIKIIHSASIEQLYYSIIDKLSAGEEIQFDSLEEEMVFRRGLAVLTAGAPTILTKDQIRAIKQVAKRYGVKCKLTEWTPDNCSMYMFDEKGTHTPFKELDSTIRKL